MKGFLSNLLVGLVCSTILISSGVSFGASIESITVYEMTGVNVSYWFAINDPRLITKIESLGESNYDFSFGPSPTTPEVYDLYISDSEGTPNPNGMYLTIDCFRNLYATGTGAAHNIDAVSLDFTDGTHLWATEVTNHILGYEQLLTIAQPENSLGSPDNLPTYMGDQFSSLTVGFDLVLPIKADVLEERVESLESLVDTLEDEIQTLIEQNIFLQQQITALEERLSNHGHTYLTGQGEGHNNTEATTGPAILP